MACHIEMVGCPAIGISEPGVKNRIAKVATFDGNAKTVSLALISRAMACICASVKPSAAVTTPQGFPAYLVVVKASTSLMSYSGIGGA